MGSIQNDMTMMGSAQEQDVVVLPSSSPFSRALDDENKRVAGQHPEQPYDEVTAVAVKPQISYNDVDEEDDRFELEQDIFSKYKSTTSS